MKKIARHIRSFFRILRRALLDGWIRQGRCKKIPKTIIIESTNLCNLKCTCCPHGNPMQENRPKGMMTRETFMKILNNIDFPIKEICLYLHGEPFLNEELAFFVNQTDQLKGILTSIYSNGYNINPDLLHQVLAHRKTRFSFSMDIVNKEYYEEMRKPASYAKAMESLKQIDTIFAAHNKKYELNMITDETVLKNSQTIANQIFESFQQVRKINFNSGFPWPEHFYTGDLTGRISKKRILCQQIYNNVSVYWNGEVTICSYDFSGKLIIGNMTDTKLSEIYNSPAARKIRKIHFMRQLKKLPVCEKCLLPRYASMTKSIIRPKIK